MRKTWWIWVVAGILLAGAAGWFLFRPAQQGDSSGSQQAMPLPGYPAPAFTLQDLAGKMVRLDQFKGRVVVLNFWATWCPSCRQELPGLEVFWREVQTKGLPVQILAVNIKEDPGTVRDFLEKNGYTFPVLLDTQGEVADTYLVQYIPTTFFIGQDGKIKQKLVGVVPESQLRAIAEGLAGK